MCVCVGAAVLSLCVLYQLPLYLIVWLCIEWIVIG